MLGKKYDQNIKGPNNYAQIVRCAHFTQSVRDRELKVKGELRAHIQMLFHYPTY